MSNYLPYLPRDIWSVILKKLPEQLLPPLRRVCKDWKAAIVGILLAKPMILCKSTTTSTTTAGGDVFSLKFDGGGYGNNIIYTCPFIPSSPLGFTIVGSCYGVVCLLDKNSSSNLRLIIWNPLTKRCLRVPQPPPPPNLPISSFPLTKAYGFGYDSSQQRFLVALLSWRRTPGVATPPNLMIFSTASGQWTVAPENPPWGGSYSILETARQAYLNGKIHWIGYSGVTHQQQEIDEERADQIFRIAGHSSTPADGFKSVILFLDVSNAEQGYIKLPHTISFMFPVSFSLGLWGEHTLALIRHSNRLNPHRTVRVYVLNDYPDSDSWECKCYIDGTGICDAFGLTTAGDLLATIEDEPLIIRDDEGLDEDLDGLIADDEELKYELQGPLCGIYASTYFETRCSLGPGEEAAAAEVLEGTRAQGIEEAVEIHEREILIVASSLLGYSVFKKDEDPK